MVMVSVEVLSPWHTSNVSAHAHTHTRAHICWPNASAVAHRAWSLSAMTPLSAPLTRSTSTSFSRATNSAAAWAISAAASSSMTASPLVMPGGDGSSSGGGRAVVKVAAAAAVGLQGAAAAAEEALSWISLAAVVGCWCMRSHWGEGEEQMATVAWQSGSVLGIESGSVAAAQPPSVLASIPMCEQAMNTRAIPEHERGKRCSPHTVERFSHHAHAQAWSVQLASLPVNQGWRCADVALLSMTPQPHPPS